MTLALRTVAVSLALSAAMAGAHAQAPIGWSNLEPAQRGVLAPLASEWKAITPAQQHKWVEVANRFGALPLDERARLQQRMADWSRLSANDRARARMNYQESRQLSREERQQQWETYRSLPPEQRRPFIERAQSARPVPQSGTRREAADADRKSSVVRSPATASPQPVGPSVVQRGAGATTSLVSKPARPPLHQQAGMPKVAATPGFVDGATLLPQRGAQGAAARPVERETGRVKGGGKNDGR